MLTGTMPTNTVTRALGSVTPDAVTVVPSLLSAGVTVSVVGGPRVSTTKRFDGLSALVEPLTVCRARTSCGPSASGVVGVKVHRPIMSAVTLPTSWPSMRTVTEAPGLAVPSMSGVVSRVTEPFAGAVTVGASSVPGAMVKTTVLLFASRCPARAAWPG
jgi:hypothetical protein